MKPVPRSVSVLISMVFMFIQGCRKTPDPPWPDSGANFEQCVVAGKTGSFEIVTLNLEGFPKEGFPTIMMVKELIESINPDIIALQEIGTEPDFNTLVNRLEGWSGKFYPELNGTWNLAFLYKNSEVTIDDNRSRLLFADDYYAFPRAPFEVFVTHKTLNISAYLVNIHLKCCGGTDNESRRRDASEKLDEYIRIERNNDPVIILGDFNDEISGESYEENVFYNFVSAPSEYRFADMNIALGTLLWWSYPSWPSHIDHILVTNELFQRIDTTKVIKPDPCYPEYFMNISDHRPLELILK